MDYHIGDGKTQRDQVRSEVIRRKLRVHPVKEKIEEHQQKWFGHVCKMPEDSRVNWYIEAKPNGRRPVGRPWTIYRRIGQCSGEVV